MESKGSQEGLQLITIAKNAGLGIFGRLFFLSARFCTALLIARTIGPEQYGIFILAMSIFTVAWAFSLMGLEPTTVKFVAQYKAQKKNALAKDFIAFGLEVSLISSLVLTLAIFLSAGFASNIIFHKTSLAPVLRIMVLALPVSSLMVILLSALQGVKLLKYKILVQQILMPSFRFISVCAAFLLGFKLIGVAWAWLITAIFGFSAAFIFYSKRMGFFFRRPLSVDRKKIIKFSLPLFLSQLFYQNINILGILIIGAFLPASQLGIYGVAMRVIPFLLIPMVSYNAIFSPIISELYTKGRMEELEHIYKTGTKWVTTLSLPLFSLMLLFSKEIVSIFGQGFTESASIIVILLIGQIVNVGTGSTGFMLSMTGKPFYNLFNSGILCALNIILTLLLISRFGIVGAAWANSISIILVQLLQIVEVWYLYKIHPYRLEHLKPLFSCLLAFLIVYFLQDYIITANILRLFILTSTFLFSYGIFLALGGLSQEDRMVFEKLRNKLYGKIATNPKS
ncbi:MAG: flippase [Proteobacteria bacterium]|nr:flippase [Pseudomonadota bacterium]